jgi:hypothetical protein
MRWFASGKRSIRLEDGRSRVFAWVWTYAGRLPSRETSFMSDKYFVDTNILMYAHDTSAGAKHERARAVVEEL